MWRRTRDLSLENVYLFVRLEGLATCSSLGASTGRCCPRAMKLRANQRIILAQTIGYPPR